MTPTPAATTPTRILACLGALLALLGLVATPAAATPLENSYYGGLIGGSVVLPHPATVTRNPAAIGLLRGTHIYVDGTARLAHGRVQRSPVSSATGQPGAGADLQFDAVQFTHWTPDLYFGLTTDLGSDLVVIGLALGTPFAEMQRWPSPVVNAEPSQEGSQRYMALRSDWFHLFASGVVAVKLHKRVYIGIGMSYVRSMIKLSFARDIKIRSGPGAGTPLNEDPEFAERVDVDGVENSFCVHAGIVIRLPGKVDIGVSYRSKVVGVNQQNIRAEGAAAVRRQTAVGWETFTGRARTIYELPDSLSVGAAWRYRRWTFNGSFEWERWSEHEDLSFTLTGNEFRTAGMGNWDTNFAHHRGFRDVFRVALGFEHRFSKRLALLTGLQYESSAVLPEWLNAAVMDGHKVDLKIALTWRPHRSVGLTFGYGVSFSPAVEVTSSGFDPGYVVRCVEDQVDILWSENCRRTTEGKALPSAAGRYFQLVHRLGMGISYDYW